MSASASSSAAPAQGSSSSRNPLRAAACPCPPAAGEACFYGRPSASPEDLDLDKAFLVPTSPPAAAQWPAKHHKTARQWVAPSPTDNAAPAPSAVIAAPPPPRQPASPPNTFWFSCLNLPRFPAALCTLAAPPVTHCPKLYCRSIADLYPLKHFWNLAAAQDSCVFCSQSLWGQSRALPFSLPSSLALNHLQISSFTYWLLPAKAHADNKG